LITGDFFVTPPRVVFDLEARLRGVETARAPETVSEFFAETPADFVNLEPGDFREVVAAALHQLSIPIGGGKTLRGHMIGSPAPDKPTLVFLHEALGCARMWRDIPHRLAQATGLPALVYDRLGAGDSDPLEPPFERSYILDEAREVLPRVLDAAHISNAILVGHSDGATIALTYAGAYPDRVSAVIAEAPHLFREDRTLAEIDRQIHDFDHGDLKARLARFHGSKTERLFQRLVDAWTGGGARDWDVDDHVARVRCPVLLLQGEEDEFFSADQIDAIEGLLDTPAERVFIPHCGHAPHHQARRAVLEAMTRFVNTAPGAVAGQTADESPLTIAETRSEL
jgi:pimeloyl-ACP methyl ester carboxylesterase